jgi:peptide deformylase
MPAHRILQLGDPTLRQKSCPVRSPAEAGPLLADLRDTLHEFRRTHGFGRGISAIQIGQPWRVIYVESDGACYALVNPAFESLSEQKIRLWDACFSFPDLCVLVERSAAVTVHYQDQDGASRTLEASGLLAELLQHEMDHLDGILAIDRAIDRNSLCTRQEYERRHRGPRPGILPAANLPESRGVTE